MINSLKYDRKRLKEKNRELMRRCEVAIVGMSSEHIDGILADVQTLKLSRDEMQKNYKLKVENLKKTSSIICCYFSVLDCVQFICYV